MDILLNSIVNNRGLWIGLLVGLFFALNFLFWERKRSLKASHIAAYIVVNCMAIGFIISQFPSRYR